MCRRICIQVCRYPGMDAVKCVHMHFLVLKSADWTLKLSCFYMKASSIFPGAELCWVEMWILQLNQSKPLVETENKVAMKMWIAWPLITMKWPASILPLRVRFKTVTMLGHLNSLHCISAVNTGILEDD